MTTYYEVAISGNPLRRAFTYASSEEIDPGTRVVVDFRNRVTIGYVLDVAHPSEELAAKTKALLEIVDYYPLLTSTHIELAKRTARYFFSPIGKVCDLFFSASPQIVVQTRLVRSSYDEMPGFESAEASVPAEVFFQRVGRKKGRVLLEEWLKEKRVVRAIGLKTRTQRTRTDSWIRPVDDLGQALSKLEKTSGKEWAIMQHLLLHAEEPASYVKKTFRVNDATLLSMAKRRLLLIEEMDDSEATYVEERGRVNLTDRQKEVSRSILRDIDRSTPVLEHVIHGVTGSGKTEVYFSVIAEILKRGRAVLFLIPEISLSPQTIARVRTRFPDVEVGIYHSALKPAQRQREWQKAVIGETKIFLGTRSALWVPMPNLGLIIVDEEHDTSYAQEDAQPYYDTKRVVRWLSELGGIPVVYGSATPRIETFYEAQELRQTRLHTLPERPLGISLPHVRLIDMIHAERVNAFFSKELVQSMDEVLSRGKQVFLLANRKGFAPFLICSMCGFVAKCVQCDVSLTYHQATRRLKCHYCGFETSLYTRCPSCEREGLHFSGYGTEKVEEVLKTLFPDRRVLRMDKEAIDSLEKLSAALERIKDKKIDIVVGTKMISKGLDFPEVELVGVLDADHFLYFPDFRSSERTFQLLSQMSGRAGRAFSESLVLVQTRSIDKTSIQKSALHDYPGFFAQETQNRKMASYPPYGHIVILNFTCYDKEVGAALSSKISTELKESLGPENKMLGPTEALIFKLSGQYRYRTMVKTQQPEKVVGAIESMFDRNPDYEKTVSVVVDPLGMIL
ncbi:MAG TPA: primosomal protein N' [Thermotogota bacterium]|jgi:primosomal protein N' (replication factor Y)|nr:primosomal protein N' [Thermotogota bacterium]HPV95091.1 primosomal protein N' [Thermotogota bacterium]HQK81845.1 primosomal protein N' [Thermotogota bacterium]